MLSARIPQEFGDQVVRHFTRFVINTSDLAIPAFSIAVLKMPSAAPTNGFPFSSSFLPGASV